MLRPWRDPSSLSFWVLRALVETAAVTPWAIVLYGILGIADWPAAIPGAWLLLLAYGGAVVWEQGSPAEGRSAGLGRLIAMGFGVTVVYLIAYELLPATMRSGRATLNPALAVLPVAAYLWYRGAAAVGERSDHGRFYARYVRQCAATLGAVLLLLAVGIADEPRVQVSLYWSLFLLVGAGLLLLAMAREQSLGQAMADAGDGGERRPGLARRMVWVVAGLVGLTVGASQVLSPARLSASLAAALRLLSQPVIWLTDVFLLIFVRWLMLAFIPYGAFIRWLRSHMRPPDPQGEDAALSGSKFWEPLDPYASRDLSYLVPYVKAFVIFGAVVVLVVLLVRLQTARSRRIATDPDEERVSLGFWQALLADLGGLRRALGPVRTSPGGATGPALEPLDPRALFRRLQAWGAAVGRPRLRYETPTVYAAAIGKMSPEGREAAERVRDLYNRTRYAEEEPGPGEAQAASDSLKGLGG